MSKFAIKKKIELGFLGDEWTTAYIILTPLAVKEFKQIQTIAPKDDSDTEANIKAMDAMLEIVKQHFVSGKGWNGEGLEAITADDLIELPMEILSACITNLAGKTDPK